ncbi:MAG: NAD(P)/FAD-dependent oxidoreductase, partial [Sneathiella sp.]
KNGLEGGALYALSKGLREELQQGSTRDISLDLKPGSEEQALVSSLSTPRGKMSLSNFLRKKLNLAPIQIALLHEFKNNTDIQNTDKLAALIKNLPVELIGINGIERAISSAGGVKFSNLDDQLMIKKQPGQFVAGEMLDWEAPTGGYLLQGCFATGVVAADGIATYLNAA